MRKLFESPTTVIELGESVAASYCGRLLLKLGANVLKVEVPDGSLLRDAEPFIAAASGRRLSAIYTALNVGKDIVHADVDTAAGRAAVDELLLEHGDIVLMSGPESDWAARGLSTERVRELVPHAVIGRVTMFGDDGPYSNFRGGELQAQALGGLMNVVGDPDRQPLRIGGYQAQRSTGLALLTGVALAMFHRSQSGVGRSFTTSVLEAVSHIEWKSGLLYQSNGTVVTRGSTGSPAILKAKDGFFAFFYRPDDWTKVVSIMGDPRLGEERFATEISRSANRSALLEILNECAGGWYKQELYHRTQAERMTTGYMASMGDLLTSDQYLARGFFEDVDLGEFGLGRLPDAPWNVVADPNAN